MLPRVTRVARYGRSRCICIEIDDETATEGRGGAAAAPAARGAEGGGLCFSRVARETGFTIHPLSLCETADYIGSPTRWTAGGLGREAGGGRRGVGFSKEPGISSRLINQTNSDLRFSSRAGFLEMAWFRLDSQVVSGVGLRVVQLFLCVFDFMRMVFSLDRADEPSLIWKRGKLNVWNFSERF